MSSRPCLGACDVHVADTGTGPGAIELVSIRRAIIHHNDTAHAPRELRPTSVTLHSDISRNSYLHIRTASGSELIDLACPAIYEQGGPLIFGHLVVLKTGNLSLHFQVDNKRTAKVLMIMLKTKCEGKSVGR